MSATEERSSKKRSRKEKKERSAKSSRKHSDESPSDNSVVYRAGAPAAVSDSDDEERRRAEKAQRKAERAARKAEKKASKEAKRAEGKQRDSQAAASTSGGGVRLDFGGVVARAERRGQLDGCSVEEADGSKVDSFEVVSDFGQLAFDQPTMKQCFAGFERPTPIQSACWAPLLRGRDVVGIAATGSGKTLAFAVPGLVHVLNNARLSSSSSKEQGPRMLVLAPTRELASQITAVCESIGTPNGVASVCIFGGVPKRQQVQAIQAGAEIVIGTPGRLLDLHAEGSLPLQRVTYVVLDEADRMLDMGFADEIRKIMAAVSSARQTVMFSATWPTEIQAFGKSFMRRPLKVTVGSESLAAAHSVKQIVEMVDARDKDRRLLALLRDYHRSRRNLIILFVLYKKEAVRVEHFLQQQGWPCIAIHGDKQQSDRTAALEQFRSGKVPLLVATDVAARGLDIPRVEYVINYSFPLTVEDYVHRIGRTGRAGSTGLAHTFFTTFDKNLAGALCNVLREAGQTVPPELEKFGPTIRKVRPAEPVLVDTSTKTHLKFDD